MEFLLETGLMPNSSPVGSSMAAIIRGTSKLTADDRHAMAVYLRALPPRQGSKPEKNRLSATKGMVDTIWSRPCRPANIFLIAGRLIARVRGVHDC